MRAFPDLPVVYLFEETSKDVFIIVGIDHRIDKPEFVIDHDLRVITVATRMIAMNMKIAFLICFAGFLFPYPDDSCYAECHDICDQTRDAM